jgi:polyphosphate kinase
MAKSEKLTVVATTVTERIENERKLEDPALYVNRELSWLEFNARVLALAADPRQPLLERCKFLAIFANNLDEFFMVRVAGHQDAFEEGRSSSTPDRLPREAILDGISARVGSLLESQSEIWHGEVRPALAEAGIVIAEVDGLGASERERLDGWFHDQVYPALTPLAVGPGLPFPYISGLSLNLGLTVRDPGSGEARFARVKVPPTLPRLVETDDGLVWLEDVISHNLADVFPGMTLDQAAQFRITRDADIDISMDQAEDLLGAVEVQLRRRRFGHAVRLEVGAEAQDSVVEQLRIEHELGPRDVYRVDGPLDMTGLFHLAGLDRPELRSAPWRPRTHPRLQGDDSEGVDMFAVIRRGDVLVHHPYDDFETSVRHFVEQAADDPDVLAIKQTVYRTTSDSPIIGALMRAAAAGKQSVCLVELQARFDEERNIRQAKLLERAGVHVIYGQAGRKTHAKLSLVIRREGDRVRRYVHIGTGNYNSSTARLYTDVGVFTCRDDITEDVADLFNHLTGFRAPPSYRKILVAPDHVRSGLIAEIERVAAAAARGVPGRVIMKCNALIDGPVIRAIYRASQAGVKVDLIVRSICGLLPGIPGVSENVRVISVVGRFLEHSRLFAFVSGEDTRYYFGSADMMVRNLDNRVEVVTPVENPAAKREIRAVLDMHLERATTAWTLGPDGTWSPPTDMSPDVQEGLMERTAARDTGPARD